jgi:hypothetical protein
MELGKVIFHFLCIVIVSFVLGRKLPQYAAEQSIDEIINYIKHTFRCRRLYSVNTKLFK